MMENYDVIVVGAGLAGLQAARLLGEPGYRLLRFEGSPRFHFPDPRRLQPALCGEGRMPASALPELNGWPAQRGGDLERETVA